MELYISNIPSTTLQTPNIRMNKKNHQILTRMRRIYKFIIVFDLVSFSVIIFCWRTCKSHANLKRYAYWQKHHAIWSQCYSIFAKLHMINQHCDYYCCSRIPRTHTDSKCCLNKIACVKCKMGFAFSYYILVRN